MDHTNPKTYYSISQIHARLKQRDKMLNVLKGGQAVFKSIGEMTIAQDFQERIDKIKPPKNKTKSTNSTAADNEEESSEVNDRVKMLNSYLIKKTRERVLKEKQKRNQQFKKFNTTEEDIKPLKRNDLLKGGLNTTKTTLE